MAPEDPEVMASTEIPTEELLAAAVAGARAGAAVLRGYFRSGRLVVGVKAANDFVTQADRESEAALVAEILRRFPEHRILAEEGTVHEGATSEHEWVIDPLDGTTNFLQGLPVWGISIACRRGEQILAGVVLDPEGENLFEASLGGGARWNGNAMRVSQRTHLDGAFLATGYPFRARAALDLYLEMFRDVFGRARAIRRCGAAALDLAYTAAGVYDGFFEFRLSPWDVAAGALLVEEAGGRISDFDGGSDHVRSGNVLAGPEGVWRDLVRSAERCGAREVTLDSRVPRT